MTLDPAGGSHPAHSWTGVNTLVPNTCQGGGAVRVDGTLGLALNVRISLEPWVTSTVPHPISIGALGIDPTGRWSAGINLWRRCGS